MRLGLARCLILYIMYGQHLEVALQWASFYEFGPLWQLLWAVCTPMVIAVGEEID